MTPFHLFESVLSIDAEKSIQEFLIFFLSAIEQHYVQFHDLPS